MKRNYLRLQIELINLNDDEVLTGSMEIVYNDDWLEETLSPLWLW